MNKSAYLDGYLYKEAEPGAVVLPAAGALAGGTMVATADTAKALLPLVVAIPMVIGGAGGYMHSALTSPTEMDLSTAQRALTAAELDEMLTNLRRQKEKARRTTKTRGTGERSLHI